MGNRGTGGIGSAGAGDLHGDERFPSRLRSLCGKAQAAVRGQTDHGWPTLRRVRASTTSTGPSLTPATRCWQKRIAAFAKSDVLHRRRSLHTDKTCRTFVRALVTPGCGCRHRLGGTGHRFRSLCADPRTCWPGMTGWRISPSLCRAWNRCHRAGGLRRTETGGAAKVQKGEWNSASRFPKKMPDRMSRPCNAPPAAMALTLFWMVRRLDFQRRNCGCLHRFCPHRREAPGTRGISAFVVFADDPGFSIAEGST